MATEARNEAGTKKYRSRYKALYEGCAEWRSQWKEIVDFLAPRRGAFLLNEGEETGKGDKKGKKILNSRASLALRTLGSGLMAGLTSPSRPWFRLVADDSKLMENEEVKSWFHGIQQGIYRVFQQSNFYGAARNVYTELGAFGFNALLIEEDPKKVIRCRPTTIGEAFIALDEQFRPDTLYRKIWLTVEQLVEQFCPKSGEGKYKQRNGDGTGVSDDVWRDYEENHFDTRYLVYHVIEPRKRRDPKDPGKRNMAYASVYFLDKAEDTDFLSIGGYRSIPFAAPRWDAIGSDIYGDCPGVETLADTKQLQKMEADKLMGLDKEVNPPMNAPTSMRDQGGTILPGGVNYVDTQQGGQSFQPVYMVRPNLNGLMVTGQAVESRINEHFYTNLFLAIINETKSMTATEAAQRLAEKMQQLSPVIERLQTEFLDVVIERTIAIMESFGMLPEPPAILQGREYKIEYISLLAQAQQMSGTVTIEQLAGFIAQIAAAKPDALDKLDTDKTIDEYAKLLGVPPEIVRSDDEVKKIRQATAQQMQAAQAAQQGVQMAQGAKLLSDAKMNGDSALDMLTGGTGL